MLRDLALNLRDPGQECKKYFLQTDIDLTSISIGAAALIALALSYLDYNYYGLATEFFVVFALEGLFAVCSVLLIFYFRRIRQIRTYGACSWPWRPCLQTSSSRTASLRMF
jgi:hypothetical protein